MSQTNAPKIDPSNAGAAEAWDGGDGAHWVEHAPLYDASIARYRDAFFAAAGIAAGARVLDIGCGSGQTTRDAAQQATAGEAVGIDLSTGQLAMARELADDAGITNVSFVHGDAQVHPFEPASFDVAISRTGTMFFGDPVAAFSNIARALRPGGRLTLLVWQGIEGNEWLAAFALALAAGRTPPAPPVGAPGPFAFADPDHVHAVLGGAGFDDVQLDDRRELMYFGRDTDEAFAFISTGGFARGMLRDLDDAAREVALDALRATFAAHATPEGVLYPSATWIVTATRP